MKRTGFTLVEILIVVIILGILAAIVIPQFTDASNEARLSSLKSDLQTVRGQVELYKMQHKGYDPTTNEAGAALDFWTQLTTKTDEDGAAGGDFGPYIGVKPGNPFRSGSTAVIVDGADDGASGWSFDTASGLFSALGTAADIDGDGNPEDLTLY